MILGVEHCQSLQREKSGGETTTPAVGQREYNVQFDDNILIIIINIITSFPRRNGIPQIPNPEGIQVLEFICLCFHCKNIAVVQ